MFLALGQKQFLRRQVLADGRTRHGVEALKVDSEMQTSCQRSGGLGRGALKRSRLERVGCAFLDRADPATPLVRP